MSRPSAKLANPPRDAGAVIKLAQEYDSVQKEMDAKLGEWEQMQA